MAAVENNRHKGVPAAASFHALTTVKKKSRKPLLSKFPGLIILRILTADRCWNGFKAQPRQNFFFTCRAMNSPETIRPMLTICTRVIGSPRKKKASSPLNTGSR